MTDVRVTSQPGTRVSVNVPQKEEARVSIQTGGSSGGGGGGTTDYSPAFNQANLALGTAQSAFGLANTDLITAQSAFTKANTACTQSDQAGTNANNAYGASNTVLIAAQSAYAQANIDLSLAQTAFTKANTACTQSDAAGTQANVAYGKANTACTQSDVAGTQANNAYGASNNVLITAQAAYGRANTSAQLAFKTANTPANNITATSNQDTILIRGGGTVVIVGNTANQTIFISDDSFTAPAAFTKANTACTQSDQAGTNANNAYGFANTVLITAQSAFTKANTACTQSDFAGTQANSAWARANTSTQLAFKTANTPANNLIATSNQDTLLIRGGNDIQITGNTANNTLIIQNDQTTEIAAFAKANTACTQSDFAGAQANQAWGRANTSAQLAFKVANTPANNLTAGSNADTIFVRGGGTVIIVGNTANNTLSISDDSFTAPAAFGKANTACTQSDTAGTQANSAWARANTSTQLAFLTANTPANNLTATSNADTIKIRGGNDIQITGNTGNNTLIIQNDTTTEIAAFAHANDAYITAQGAFAKANLSGGSGGGNAFLTVNTPANNLTATSNVDVLRVRGGNDITVTGNSANNTLIISNDQTTEIAAYARANTSAQLAFKTVNTPANNIIATTNVDTLIIRGGGTVTINGNTANQTITINDDSVTAPAAYARANTSAQLAFLTANTPANNLTATSNSDTIKIRGGNDIQITGNTGNNTLIIQNDTTTEIAAFAKANTACTQSDVAGTQANSAWARGNTSAQLAFKVANTPANNITASSNQDTILIRGGNDIQITGNTANQTIIIQNDTTTEIAAFAKANTACTQSDFAGAQANSAWARGNTSAQLAFKTVNTPANNIIASTNTDTLIIRGGNNIIIQGNTANQTLIITDDTRNEIAAFAQANLAYTQGNNAYNFANTVLVTAQGAFSKANAALANTTGTFQGDLNITGNLSFKAISNLTGKSYFASTTSDQQIDSFANTFATSVAYTITANVGNSVHMTHLHVIQDNILAYKSEYGVLYSNVSLASYSVNYAGGVIGLNATPTLANTTFKIYKVSQ